MNLGQLRQLVITQANAKGVAITDLEAPLINELINRGIEEFCYETNVLMTTASCSTASSVEMYALPASVVRVWRVDVASSTAEYRNILDVAEINAANTSTPGWA